VPDTAKARPAHRPSRREEVLDAAVRIFAAKGFAGASMQEVAAEAGVVQTAVYYHFAGKEELLTEVLKRVFDQVSDQVLSVGRQEGGAAGLAKVIDAVWDWLDEHPDEALLYATSALGGTGDAVALRHAFEQRHLDRAFAYFSDDQHSRNRRAAQRFHAQRTLTLRVMISALTTASALRTGDGALSTQPPLAVRREVAAVSARLLGG
jgi:AcrR family transcriptional regulator